MTCILPLLLGPGVDPLGQGVPELDDLGEVEHECCLPWVAALEGGLILVGGQAQERHWLPVVVVAPACVRVAVVGDAAHQQCPAAGAVLDRVDVGALVDQRSPVAARAGPFDPLPVAAVRRRRTPAGVRGDLDVLGAHVGLVVVVIDRQDRREYAHAGPSPGSPASSPACSSPTASRASDMAACQDASSHVEPTVAWYQVIVFSSWATAASARTARTTSRPWASFERARSSSTIRRRASATSARSTAASNRFWWSPLDSVHHSLSSSWYRERNSSRGGVGMSAIAASGLLGRLVKGGDGGARVRRVAVRALRPAEAELFKVVLGVVGDGLAEAVAGFEAEGAPAFVVLMEGADPGNVGFGPLSASRRGLPLVLGDADVSLQRGEDLVHRLGCAGLVAVDQGAEPLGVGFGDVCAVAWGDVDGGGLSVAVAFGADVDAPGPAERAAVAVFAAVQAGVRHDRSPP